MVAVLEVMVSELIVPKEDVVTIPISLIDGGSQLVPFVLISERDGQTPTEVRLEGDDRVWTREGVFGEDQLRDRRPALAKMIEKLRPGKDPLVVSNHYFMIATSVAVFGAPKQSG